MITLSARRPSRRERFSCAPPHTSTVLGSDGRRGASSRTRSPAVPFKTRACNKEPFRRRPPPERSPDRARDWERPWADASATRPARSPRERPRTAFNCFWDRKNESNLPLQLPLRPYPQHLIRKAREHTAYACPGTHRCLQGVQCRYHSAAEQHIRHGGHVPGAHGNHVALREVWSAGGLLTASTRGRPRTLGLRGIACFLVEVQREACRISGYRFRDSGGMGGAGGTGADGPGPGTARGGRTTVRDTAVRPSRNREAQGRTEEVT